MTATDIGVWFGIAVTVLGMLLGAAWWMSAVYAKLSEISEDVKDHGQRLNEHSKRIGDLEHGGRHRAAREGAT